MPDAIRTVTPASGRRPDTSTRREFVVTIVRATALAGMGGGILHLVTKGRADRIPACLTNAWGRPLCTGCGALRFCTKPQAVSIRRSYQAPHVSEEDNHHG